MIRGRLSGLAAWPPGILASSALVAIFCAAVVGFVVGLVVFGDHSFEYYSANPTKIHDASPLVGLLSQLGVLLLWGAGSAAVFAGALVARRRGWRQAMPALLAGGGIAYLAFDDLFRLHEEIYPRVRIEQEAVFLAYAALGLAFLWWFRDSFRREWPLLALALSALGLSVLSDQKAVDLGATLNRWLEDGVKVFGVAFLALYVVRLSVRMLEDAYPAEPAKSFGPRASRRAGRLWGVLPATALVATMCALTLGVVAMATTVSEHPFGYFSKDPASTLSASPVVGLLAYAGVLVAWGAASASLLAAAFVARAQGWRAALPLLALGAATAYVALDDLFRFQELVFPLLETGADSVFVGYVLVALALLGYRDVFRRHEPGLAALALSLLGGSALLYVSGLDEPAACLQLLGLAFLAAYVLRLGARMVAQSYPLAATPSLETARDVEAEPAAPRVART